MGTNEIIALLLAILGFIGALSVHALMSIAKSVNEIKSDMRVAVVKHDALENRVTKLEDHETIHNRRT